MQNWGFWTMVHIRKKASISFGALGDWRSFLFLSTVHNSFLYFLNIPMLDESDTKKFWYQSDGLLIKVIRNSELHF